MVIRKVKKMTSVKVILYFKNILIAFWNIIWQIIVGLDRLANTLLGGDPNMTLSGRMGRDIKEGLCSVCKIICWVLNKIQTNHCANQAVIESSLGSEAADQGD